MSLVSVLGFLRKYRKPLVWLCCLALMIGATWWVIQGIETKIKAVDIVTDEDLTPGSALEVALETAGAADGGAFFAGYRLQRERVRDRSMEMLQTLLDSPNAGAGAREEAEQLLLEIVRLREQELMVENMIRAQGYEDAVFFYREDQATIMVKEADLDERSFIQISETVAGAVGIERENVQVMARP